MRRASVIVADEITLHLNGKINISGVYSSDIVIPASPVMINQLMFLFIIEASPDDIYKKLAVSVKLPIGALSYAEVNLDSLNLSEGDSISWRLHWPAAFYGAILTPGQIECKIIHENGEFMVPCPVIHQPGNQAISSQQSISSPAPAPP